MEPGVIIHIIGTTDFQPGLQIAGVGRHFVEHPVHAVGLELLATQVVLHLGDHLHHAVHPVGLFRLPVMAFSVELGKATKEDSVEPRDQDHQERKANRLYSHQIVSRHSRT